MTTLRIVFIGNSDVGKTTLAHRMRAKTFHDNISNTVGAEFSTTTKSKIKLQLWDTAGQERYRSLVPLYFRHADIFLLVFDISDRQSFDAIEEWIRLVRVTHECDYGRVPIILVGNKSDKRKIHVESFITEEEIKKKAGTESLWCEISALNGSGVKELEKLLYQTTEQNEVETPAKFFESSSTNNSNNDEFHQNFSCRC